MDIFSELFSCIGITPFFLILSIISKKEEKVKSWVQTYLAANPVTDPDFISCEVEMLPNSKIEQLRKNKIILGWTVKTKQESETYFPYCDNLIAENFL